MVALIGVAAAKAMSAKRAMATGRSNGLAPPDQRRVR
jgi:hypothetical protein